MKKYIILALQLAFFVSSLLFFSDNISLIFVVLLTYYLSLENKYYSLIPLLICGYFDTFYVFLAILSIFILLMFGPIIKKNRFYHFALFTITLILINVLEIIFVLFNLNTLIVSLLALIIYSVINFFTIFSKVNNNYITTSINDKLITLTLLLGYLILFVFYNTNNLLLIFLFIQLYLLKDYKYNFIFFICYFFLYFIKYNVVDVNSLNLLASSYLPISSLITFDYQLTKTYFYIFYILLIMVFSYDNKTITVESNYINNLFRDFKKYIDGLNLEFNRLYSIEKIKDNHLENIIKNYCTNCKKNTICKYKPDKRISFIRFAMLNKNNNIYDCPYYDEFYIDSNINVKTPYEYSAIKELTFELEYLYNQSLKLSKGYNKFVKDLTFYGYYIKNIDINLANPTLYFSFQLNSKKPVICNIFLKVGQKAFGEELAMKWVEKDDVVCYYIYKKPKVKIEYSHIILPKDNNIISGDNFYIKKDYNDTYIFALSDGMGSGHNAYVESKETLRLMANLSNYHFSFKTILKLLEDIYNLRCDFDSYATLDLALINTSNMKLTLYKLGSTTTYIYHNFSLTNYENKSLPLKLDDINSTYDIEFFKDDIILLLSDGITDFLNKDELFLAIDPNLTANEIMISITNKVKEKEKTLKDDLSLIVIKVI